MRDDPLAPIFAFMLWCLGIPIMLLIAVAINYYFLC